MYYIPMTQPSTPPISLRIPPFLLARLEAWAEEHKTTRNAAIIGAIEKLVAEPERVVPAEAPKFKGKPAAPRAAPKLAEPSGGRVALPLGPQKFVARLKNR